MGCSVAMLRNIEYGGWRPSTQIAELIANVLDIPPSEHETFIRVARGKLRTDREADCRTCYPCLGPEGWKGHPLTPVRGYSFDQEASGSIIALRGKWPAPTNPYQNQG